jgi:hypothetical protein
MPENAFDAGLRGRRSIDGDHNNGHDGPA